MKIKDLVMLQVDLDFKYMKKILTLIIIVGLSFFAGYKVISVNSYRAGFSKAFDINGKCEELVNNGKDQSEEYPVPECDSSGGGCPEYQHFDVDGDGKRESYLQRMLTRLNTEEAPIVKSGTAGERYLNLILICLRRRKVEKNVSCILCVTICRLFRVLLI